MIGPLLRRASPAGPAARLSILIFHRVLARPDPIFPGEVDTARFDAICRWLSHWFKVLPLDEAIVRLASGTLPAAAACITFDDGYADNHDCAMPILRRHGLSATFFIASDFLGGGRMFNDSVIEAVRRAEGPQLDLTAVGIAGLGRVEIASPAARADCIGQLLKAVKYLDPEARREAVDRVVRACGSPRLPSDLMMTPDQVRGLHRAGMGIGGHTRSHPILARLPEAAMREEIEGGKRDLESIVGDAVTLFAYPNGKPEADYNAVSVRLAREAGFRAAVSTAWGAAGRASDPFQLPRHTPWDRARSRFGLRLLRNLRQPVDTVGT